MKGIAHFVTGVAAASFLPWSIEAALRGDPLYFILGGAFGLLPDTIDFKFYRFFYRHDVYIEPDPANRDPQAIADALAGAVARARAERRTIRVKLSTLRLGADLWQQYRVRFDPDSRQVMVALGPAVNTGQVPMPGAGEGPARVGRAALAAPVVQTYEAVTTVDIFDGPTYAFEPDAQDRVTLHFLPWHRNWSHSFLVGAAFALLLLPLLGWRAAVAILAGYSGHLIEDQFGFMGSNLFFPLTRRRQPGARSMRSADAIPNFVTVWTCGLLIFWNLYRAAPEPLPWNLTFLQLLLWGAAPVAIFLLVHRLIARGPAEKEEIDLAREWGDTMT